MRVLMVQTYHYYRGGDSTYMFNLSRLLEEKGHEVVHFAMDHPDNLDSKWSGYFASEIDFPKLLEEFSPGAAVKVISKSIYNREAKKLIASLADKTKPDIAHFHNIHGHLTTSILGPLGRRGIPVVWTLHDYRLVCPNTTFLRGNEVCERCLPRKYYHALLGRCKKGSLPASAVAMATNIFDRVTRVPSRVSRFIAPSAFLKGKLEEGRIDPARVTVIPNFVDASAYGTAAGGSAGGSAQAGLIGDAAGGKNAAAGDQAGPGPEGKYYLYFGRLSFEKGIDLLIKAAAKAGKGTLRIAGDGPSAGELRELAASAGADVEFLGFMTGDQLKAQLLGASFVVVPSRWYENLPFSVMEAMAAGKPVVASRMGGIPEMVEDGATGLLFENCDVEALAGCLKRLMDDPGLAARMGEAARGKAASLYNGETHYDQIMKVYREVLGS